MTDQNPSTVSVGKNVLPDKTAIEAFRTNMRGTVILPADESYNEARSIWNAMIGSLHTSMTSHYPSRVAVTTLRDLPYATVDS